jgi:creatinine amidohydrolase/Fe(II)-dependent formamide hydrolase-like protein
MSDHERFWDSASRIAGIEARKEIGFHNSKYYWHDLAGASPVRLMEWWSRISQTGVIGDPTVASAENGKLWFEATVKNLVEFIGEFKAMEIRSE